MTENRARGKGENKYEEESIRAWLRLYKRRSAALIWEGAGLAGFVVLVTNTLGNEILKDTNLVFRSVIVSLILLSGAALAVAGSSYEYYSARIENALSAGDSDESAGKTGATSLEEKYKAPSRETDVPYYVSIAAFALAAVTYLVAAWWEVLGL